MNSVANLTRNQEILKKIKIFEPDLAKSCKRTNKTNPIVAKADNYTKKTTNKTKKTNNTNFKGVKPCNYTNKTKKPIFHRLLGHGLCILAPGLESLWKIVVFVFFVQLQGLTPLGLILLVLLVQL